MKEVNFFLSVICRIIFNDKKYKDLKGLTTDDLLCIQMLAQHKDKKENDLMKEQFITNQKEGLSETIMGFKKLKTMEKEDSNDDVTNGIKGREHAKSKTLPPNLYSQCML